LTARLLMVNVTVEHQRGRERGMLYSVQVRLVGSDIASGMTDMRRWLQREGVEPDKFEIQRMDADGVVYRIDFKVASEAAAFAEAFAGTVVG
jgi:hypothetical protein